MKHLTSRTVVGLTALALFDCCLPSFDIVDQSALDDVNAVSGRAPIGGKSAAGGNITTGGTVAATVVAKCGDGIVQNGEACDEGIVTALTGVGSSTCAPGCKLPSCGDGILSSGEACDLGLQNGRTSACSVNCTLPTAVDTSANQGGTTSVLSRGGAPPVGGGGAPSGGSSSTANGGGAGASGAIAGSLPFGTSGVPSGNANQGGAPAVGTGTTANKGGVSLGGGGVSSTNASTRSSSGGTPTTSGATSGVAGATAIELGGVTTPSGLTCSSSDGGTVSGTEVKALGSFAFQSNDNAAASGTQTVHGYFGSGCAAIAVSVSGNLKGSGDSLAANPSIIDGWHRGYGWTDGYSQGLAKKVSDLSSIQTSMTFNSPSGYKWGVAYDIWLDPNTGISQPGGSSGEVMVWLDYSTTLSSALVGSKTGIFTASDGSTWEVWTGVNTGGWKVVTYRRTPSSAGLSNFDLLQFIKDSAVGKGMSTSMYLLSIQAGFELFDVTSGGAINNYTLSIK